MTSNVFSLWLRKITAPGALSEVDNDGFPARGDAQGRLWVRTSGDIRSTTILSGSTDGKPISVTTSYTTLHTVAAGATEQVWLWASNSSVLAQSLFVEWGVAGSDLRYTLLTLSTAPLVQGAALYHPTSALTIRAKLDAGTSCYVVGYTQRIT